MSSDPVNVYDAKTHFSRLLARVEDGEHVVISRHGRPVARLVPYRPDAAPRRPGSCRGLIRISDDFDELSPNDEHAWYGV